MSLSLVSLPVWGYVIVTLVMTHITIAGVTIYLHRHQAHRALDLHPAVANFFRFWLWLTTGMNTKAWAAVHRKHHARVETEEDPHSPHYFGIKTVLLEGAELYGKAAQTEEVLEKYGHGTPDDWLEHNLYKRYPTLGLGILLVVDVFLFGPIGITIWAVQMLWIPFLAAGVINGLGHWWGHRNYETPDASANIFPWGILIGGEELHNNHHAFPSSAKLSCKWWEADIGWLYIRLLAMLRLATVKKLAPKPVVRMGKVSIDLDTLRAVVTNRLHVMSDYASEVVVRVYREECRKADTNVKALLKPVRALLTREDSQITDEAKRYLERVLELNPSLEVVYEFKLRLQQLWKEKTATQESLLKALQDWCRQAEETGIRALQEFALYLRSYTMQPA